MPKPKVAILASGSGTTAESFIEASATGKIDCEVVLVICNNPKAGVFEKVANLNSKYNLDIKSIHIGSSNYPAESGENIGRGKQTLAEEKAILDLLLKLQIDLVLLLGYMKLVGPSIVREFGWQDSYSSVYQARMINTHPGLLPGTKSLYGIYVQEEVLKSNLKAGHSLFVVDNEYDDGPLISEHEVPVLPDDTPETLFERVKASEKTHLIEDIRKFLLEQKKYLGIK